MFRTRREEETGHPVDNVTTTGFVLLLPDIDQAPMYNQWDFNVTSTNAVGTANSLPIRGGTLAQPNRGLSQNVLPEFLCPSDPSPLPYAWVWSSEHVGGAQFVMGDGAVRFLSENLDKMIFVRLNLQADNGVVGEF